MIRKKNKQAVVGALEANEAYQAQAMRGAKSDDYKHRIREALNTTKSHTLRWINGHVVVPFSGDDLVLGQKSAAHLATLRRVGFVKDRCKC